MFATVSSSGKLYIYDLVQSKHKPYEVIPFDEEMANQVPLQLRQAQKIMFNPRQRDCVAVGYHDTTVRVFRLSRGLSNMSSQDHPVMKVFLEEKDKME